jgi:putative ubiquitin-RnfH superfamily antitoxin RatB of RatAB toxin-antitoxin module
MAECIALDVYWHDEAGVPLLRRVELPLGSTLLDAVRASGVEALLPAAWQASLRLAVWGELRDPRDIARDGDRIDLLRALRIDPKEARLRRARHRARVDAQRRG